MTHNLTGVIGLCEWLICVVWCGVIGGRRSRARCCGNARSSEKSLHCPCPFLNTPRHTTTTHHHRHHIITQRRNSSVCLGVASSNAHGGSPPGQDPFNRKHQGDQTETHPSNCSNKSRVSPPNNHTILTPAHHSPITRPS